MGAEKSGINMKSEWTEQIHSVCFYPWKKVDAQFLQCPPNSISFFSIEVPKINVMTYFLFLYVQKRGFLVN